MADICCADPAKVAAALQAASPHREALSPELLQYLRRDWSSLGTNRTDEESPLYLYYLAAEWRLTEAFPLLLSLLRQENADELLGDFLTDGAATVLATLWPGGLDGLEALVLAPEDTMDPFARVAALETISALVDFGKLSRAEGLACFRRLAEQLERRVEEGPEVDDLQITLSALVSQLMDLRAVELRDVMERLYATGHVDSSWTGSLADATAELTTPRSRPLVGPIESAWDEVRNWDFFAPEPFDPRTVPVPYQAPVLPGRNDPCICGSGKKYKKCCG